MDLQHGILLFVIGCTVTFIGFFMAFLVINYNQKKEQKIKNRPKNPLYDLNKDMPGSKAGDDCQ
tara:strand:+ start:242 stop:433 length:192 start_codon:yes stop_codon:yes gene_type:complete